MITFDLAQKVDLTPKELLTTTRAVRKRLDLSRPVELDVVRECIEIAQQAPSGSNLQPWRMLVVSDGEKRQRIAEFYRAAFALHDQSVEPEILRYAEATG